MSLGTLFSGNLQKQETMATKKTAKAPKGQVKLREKKLKDGSSSLYLDINVGGKRHKEYLKLYLVVPTNAQDKEVNRQTLAAANAMRARRELEIINGKFDISQPKQEGVRFLEYYRKMCEDRLKTPDSKGNWGNWHSCLKHLEVYCDEATTFDDINAEWIQGFKDYLNTAEKDAQKKKDPKISYVFQGLSQNSVNDNAKVYQKIIQKYTTSTECCKGTNSLLYITYC